MLHYINLDFTYLQHTRHSNDAKKIIHQLFATFTFIY